MLLHLTAISGQLWDGINHLVLLAILYPRPRDRFQLILGLKFLLQVIFVVRSLTVQVLLLPVPIPLLDLVDLLLKL